MKSLIVFFGLFGFLASSYAEETVVEKAKVEVKAAARSAKKGANRASEYVCGTLTGDSKVECLAKKAKNRVVEAKDVVKDKAVEVKDAVDTDKK